MKILTAPSFRLAAMALILLALGILLTFGQEIGMPVPTSAGAAAEQGSGDGKSLTTVPSGGLLLGFGIWTATALTIRSWRGPALWGAGFGLIGLAAGSILELVRHPEWNTSLVIVAIVSGVVGIWNPIAGIIHGRAMRHEDHEEDEEDEEEEEDDDEEA